MRRVRHVDSSGEHLDGRPFETVPGEVEDTYRNSDINSRCAGDGVSIEAVPQRAREQDQRVVRRQLREQTRRQAVHVFADAGALAQRRTVVEEDAHARPMVPCYPYRFALPGGCATTS